MTLYDFEFEIGQEVCFRHKNTQDMTAIVIGINIRSEQTISYHVNWMAGGKKEDEWFYGYELKAIDSEKKEIGFNNK